MLVQSFGAVATDALSLADLSTRRLQTVGACTRHSRALLALLRLPGERFRPCPSGARKGHSRPLALQLHFDIGSVLRAVVGSGDLALHLVDHERDTLSLGRDGIEAGEI